MTVERSPEDDISLLSSYFLALSEMMVRFGRLDLLPFTVSWTTLSAEEGLEVRALTQSDSTLKLQALFQDKLRLEVRSDVHNQKTWQSIESRYDDDGDIIYKTTTADNGVQRDDVFNNGLRVAIRYTDQSDVKPWADVTNFYDAAGTRIEKLTHYDDGRQRQDFYDNGNRVQTIMSDFTDGNNHVWDSIVSDYNQFGQRTAKTTIYDDGSRRVETFENGVRIQLDRTDGADESWSTIHASYSLFGDLETREIVYDTGVQRVETYFHNDLVEMVQTDAANVQDWDVIAYSYDVDGNVERKETLFDDDDSSVLIYEAGERQSRLDIDADGSEIWLYRITTYEQNEVLSVETYDEGEPVDLLAFQSSGEFPGDIGPPPVLIDLTENDFIV